MTFDELCRMSSEERLHERQVLATAQQVEMHARLESEMASFTVRMKAALQAQIYGPTRDERLERMARDAGRVIFGNILTPTENPFKGLEALGAEL